MKIGLKLGLKIISDKIKSVDRYSRTITLTFNNKISFGTVFGGLVPIITYVVLAIYAYVVFRTMFERNGTERCISIFILI